ncbi:MAG: hypothetical protein U5R06_05490 [candidate division KSB1 bacterium]|nr:hypothetical protein [candidate division KSB1 bacterium]
MNPYKNRDPARALCCQFRKNDNQSRIRDKLLIPLVMILVVVLGFFIGDYFLDLKQENIKLNQNFIKAVQATKHPVWSVFNQSSLPNMIVLGEIYFFRKYDPDLQQFVLVRYNQVESDDELEKLKQQYPSRHSKPFRKTVRSILP